MTKNKTDHDPSALTCGPATANQEQNMPRKIIQIAADSSSSSAGNAFFASIYALCDDGTVWDFIFQERKWTRIPDVPQENEETPSENKG